MGDIQRMAYAVCLDPADDLVGLVLFVAGNLQGDGGARIENLQALLGVRHNLFERGGILEQISIQRRLIYKRPQNPCLMLLFRKARQQIFEGDDLFQDRQEAPARHIRLAALDVHFDSLHREVRQIVVEGAVILQIPLGLGFLYPE